MIYAAWDTGRIRSISALASPRARRTSALSSGDTSDTAAASSRRRQSRDSDPKSSFRGWSAEIFVDFLPGQLNPAEVAEMVRTAGEVVGLGDWRPRFGWFTVERL